MNSEAAVGPMEKEEEEEGRSYATRPTYIDILDTYVLPKWDDVELRKVRTVQVEKWLRKLKRVGKSKERLARGSKAKIRSVMSVLFNHAIRHELMPLGSNPITMVRQSAKRMQTPDISRPVNSACSSMSYRIARESWCCWIPLPDSAAAN